jgi:hypothetical protein
MSAPLTLTTSDTVSTTTPICTGPTAVFTSTTMMQVRSPYSMGGRPNLRRRSTTGITRPRRFMTPLKKDGAWGMAVMSSMPMISRTLRISRP